MGRRIKIQINIIRLIIFFIEIHEVKTVVIPISDDEELSLKNVVYFINQIYFTEENIVLLDSLKGGNCIIGMKEGAEGLIDNPMCKTVYFPDKDIRYNVKVPTGSGRHYDLVVSNIRNDNGALLLI